MARRKKHFKCCEQVIMDKDCYLCKASKFVRARKFLNIISNWWMVPGVVFIMSAFVNPMNSKNALYFCLEYKNTVMLVTGIMVVTLIFLEWLTAYRMAKLNITLNNVEIVKEYKDKCTILSWLLSMKDYWSNEEPWLISPRSIIAQVTVEGSTWSDTELIEAKRSIVSGLSESNDKD